jgi:hypothetical protein
MWCQDSHQRLDEPADVIREGRKIRNVAVGVAAVPNRQRAIAQLTAANSPGRPIIFDFDPDTASWMVQYTGVGCGASLATASPGSGAAPANGELAYLQNAYNTSGVRSLIWQVPINSSLSRMAQNVGDNWQGNFVQYWLTPSNRTPAHPHGVNVEAFANAGVIGILFNAAQPRETNGTIERIMDGQS